MGVDQHKADIIANREEAEPAAEDSSFPLRVPPHFASLIDPDDPDDPLMLQVLPSAAERLPGGVRDPVGDRTAIVGQGVIQKYAGRILLIASGACAIHCRYCFRRHFPYAAELASRDGWQAALRATNADTTLREVILSGGDPLMLSVRRLRELSQRLGSHIHRLRIHSRIPTVEPGRVGEDLLEWIAELHQTCVVVLHVNHARELGGSTEVLQQLRQAGALLLNQAVLLRGVNDRADALEELSEALIANGILPYYLHMLDPVEGASHFDVGERRARELMHVLRSRLSGYLVPRLVRESAGAPYKLPVL